ncbi:MAG: tRNA 2-thiocytidine(32) synthetase TtcA [Syntrophomonadaceae bacterium]|nr:tRNA 2-thiocytidine(32) synthetase TtcA [Syntrophomonadaceae bacterium]
MSQRLIRRMFRQVRDANIKYHLVESGDKIAVAMSGGKDSIVMLYFLDLLLKHTPLLFEIKPLYLDMGFGNDAAAIASFCRDIGYELIIQESNVGKVVFENKKSDNPCALCSHLRRGALCRLASAHDCNKLALGHHMDDVVNTLFMSMLYEGRYHVFKPITHLDRADLYAIRPLIYVEEKDIRALCTYLEIQPVKNLCPADGLTKRAETGDIVNQIEKIHPGARRKFLASIENVRSEDFWS